MMNIRFPSLRRVVAIAMLNTTAVQAAAPVVAPGLWQITIVDFADRTSVAKECITTSDWGWWIVYAGKTAGDESCDAPIANIDGAVLSITQACKSVSAQMKISDAGEGRLAGNLTISSLTPYGIAIPFHSKLEAQRLDTDCR